MLFYTGGSTSSVIIFSSRLKKSRRLRGAQFPPWAVGGDEASLFANSLFCQGKNFEKRLWSINSGNNNNNTIEIIQIQVKVKSKRKRRFYEK